MYRLVKGLLLALFKAPGHPPEPPAGSPDSVQVFRASKKFLYYRLLLALFNLSFAVVVEVAILLATLGEGPMRRVETTLAAVALVLTLLALPVKYFLTRLEYDMRYYIVTDRSLRIRQGIWVITEITLTYANIQHLEVHQGPIQRLLGISDVIVHTAGGAAAAAQGDKQSAVASHQGILRGVDNAAELRDRINELLKRYRDAGLGDPEQAAGAGPAPRRAAAWSPAVLERLREIRDELRAWAPSSPAPSDPAPPAL